MSRSVSFPMVASAGYAAVAAQGIFHLFPESGTTLCPFRLITGLPCPGCGMGHALVSAWRGDFAGSFHSHPLGLPLLVLWTAWLGWGGLNMARGREFSDGFLPALRRPAATWGFLALVLAVYAARVAML